MTRRERFLMDLETMLSIYFLQQWLDLSDPAAEDAICDIESMRRFARVELGEDAVPARSRKISGRMNQRRSRP